MRVIADFHLHSRFSRATSVKMNVPEITRFARIKGLTLVGTGDFTHPRWLTELERDLREADGTGLYQLLNDSHPVVYFVPSGEVSTVFTYEHRVRKIHHLILAPSLEIARQINDRLARYGNLASDGRPILNLSAPHLVEEVMQVCTKNIIIPAHIWTPWFSLFGIFSGFHTIEACYQDMTRHIHALETGLSSDPPMNWRLSKLDKFALVSNSDSHSPWPWRIGREANVFELPQLTYDAVVGAILNNDPTCFRFTIETDPAYGKYHWTGHRNCDVSLSPQEAIRVGNRCPVCRRNLTQGVDQRVHELADRPIGFKREHGTGFTHLLPLSEIIAAVLGVTSPSLRSVWKIYNSLIARFGDEYTVLLEASLDELMEVAVPKIAEAIIRVRQGEIKVIPGYDGVYGRLSIRDHVDEDPQPGKKPIPQRSLVDFM